MGVPGGCFECPLQPSRTWKAALRGNQPVSRPRRSLSPRGFVRTPCDTYLLINVASGAGVRNRPRLSVTWGTAA